MDHPLSSLRRRKWMLVFICIMGLCMILLYTYELTTVWSCKSVSTPRYRQHPPPPGSPTLRTAVAREIHNILHDLRIAREGKRPPGAQTLIALQKVLGQLDPLLVPLPPLSYQDQQALLRVDNSSEEVEVCPEVYQGHTHTPSFTSSCSNSLAIGDLVTLALDSTGISPNTFFTLLQNFVDRYDSVPVVVAVASSEIMKVCKIFKNVKVVLVTISTPVVIRWTRLVAAVSTKYILVGRRITAFSSHSNLERLVRVMRLVPDVVYVSGASKDELGHWKVGCYQSRLELYGLTVREGYTNSDLGCMYCGAVDGPFLTTTEFMTSTQLDYQLRAWVSFQDWFLRVQATGRIGLACPDVLFFVATDQPSWSDRKPWSALAVKWGLTHIHLPNHTDHHFTCKQAHLDCGETKKHLAVPSCCLARLGRGLREVVSALQGQDVPFQVANNTVFNAVKGGLQPILAEAHLLAQANKSIIDKSLSKLYKRGFTVKKEEGNKRYTIYISKMNIYLYVEQPNLTNWLPGHIDQNPTLVYLGGGWLPGPSNPGLYARDHLGEHSLRHLSPEQRWPPCPPPYHHACLNLLPHDGTLTKLH